MAGTAGMVTAAAEQRDPATPLRLRPRWPRNTTSVQVYIHVHVQYTARKQIKGAIVPCKAVRAMYTYVQLVDGPILTSRPIHVTGSRRPETHFGYNARK